MKKCVHVLDQLFGGLCVPNSLQAQVEGIFALYRWGNQKRKLVFIIGIVTPKKGSLKKPVGIFQITLSTQGRKRLLMKEKLKNKPTYIGKLVKNIIIVVIYDGNESLQL